MAKKETFESFYQKMYGSRWSSLKEALLKEREPIAYFDSLIKPYYLDEASIIAAKQLPIKSSDTVLDMCAAPGGKSLILVGSLESGSLVCNDRSSARRARLKRVINEHLPKEKQNLITITSHDATKWGLYEQDLYDAILLDAPCSSERHLLNDPNALKQWSINRTKSLAIQQFAMLAAALEAVKVGGYILYSTCTISKFENEDVIAKLEKKRKERYETITLNPFNSENLSYGSIILPDVSKNLGPIYFCLIRRVS